MSVIGACKNFQDEMEMEIANVSAWECSPRAEWLLEL